MKLTYIKGNEVISTNKTNSDVEITITNKDNRTTVAIKALADITLDSAVDTLQHKFNKKDVFLLNGYQSWTDTREYSYKEHLKNARKIPKFLDNMFKFTSYGDSVFYEMKKNTLHAFEYSYVRGASSLFIGSKNYNNAFLITEYQKKKNIINLVSDVKGLSLAKGTSFVVYDYVVCPDYQKGLDEYFAEYKPRTNDKLFGYTSWYNHYQNINEEIILKALDESDDRFDLFQIDDGYETFVGDWLSIDPTKFPNGLKPIVDKVHAKGMKAGIWLAPFVAETKSVVFQNHPDWIAKNADGSFRACGGNWSGFYALDMNNPEVIAYIRKFLSYYVELGFDFFKLDFLYGSVNCGLKGYTRAQASKKSYDLLRECLGDKLILGCGAIVSNAYGVFDFMRIGPDVSLIFDDVRYMRLFHRERISTKITLQNTIFRHPMNGKVFLNDPDVFLLRDDNIKLSFEQRYALTKINSLFGSLLMTSDNPKNYDAKKTEVLNEALDNFRNAKVISYKKNGKNIAISYELNGKLNKFTYNTEKGVVNNG